MSENKEGRRKAESKGFAALGVPVGAVLTFRAAPSVTCTVLDGKNKVEYCGKTYTISGLAKELMKTAVSGYNAFKHKGVLLAKLRGKDGGTAVSASGRDTPEKPAGLAHDAPGAGTADVSRIVPLPKPQDAAGVTQKEAANGQP